MQPHPLNVGLILLTVRYGSHRSTAKICRILTATRTWFIFPAFDAWLLNIRCHCNDYYCYRWTLAGFIGTHWVLFASDLISHQERCKSSLLLLYPNKLSRRSTQESRPISTESLNRRKKKEETEYPNQTHGSPTRSLSTFLRSHNRQRKHQAQIQKNKQAALKSCAQFILLDCDPFSVCLKLNLSSVRVGGWRLIYAPNAKIKTTSKI